MVIVFKTTKKVGIIYEISKKNRIFKEIKNMSLKAILKSGVSLNRKTLIIYMFLVTQLMVTNKTLL